MGGHDGRAAFLGRVRERLAAGIPDNHLRPVERLDGTVPLVRYVVGDGSAVRRFTEAAAKLGVDVREGDSPQEVLREVCATRGVRRAVVSHDPECDGLEPYLRDLGVEILAAGDSVQTETADLGVTGAVGGIALTGSLIVDSSRAGTRTASLLPPVHVALLRRDTILDTPGDLWRHLPEHLPDGLPSNLVLITGPSRSADIEMQLTIGVHGPTALVVALL